MSTENGRYLGAVILTAGIKSLWRLVIKGCLVLSGFYFLADYLIDEPLPIAFLLVVFGSIAILIVLCLAGTSYLRTKRDSLLPEDPNKWRGLKDRIGK